MDINNNINNINETIELRNEIRTLEICTTLFILFGEFPKKPFCVKYILDKYNVFKWIIVILFLYNKNFPLKILILVLIFYKLFYICDELFFNEKIINYNNKINNNINFNHNNNNNFNQNNKINHKIKIINQN